MAVALSPLVGTSCNDEAMPPGTDMDCSSALFDAEPLRAAMERTPMALVADESYENRPSFDPGATPSMGMGPRR